MTVTARTADLTGGRPVVPSRGALRPMGPAEVGMGRTGSFLPAESGGVSSDRRGREFTDSEVCDRPQANRRLAVER